MDLIFFWGLKRKHWYLHLDINLIRFHVWALVFKLSAQLFLSRRRFCACRCNLGMHGCMDEVPWELTALIFQFRHWKRETLILQRCECANVGRTFGPNLLLVRNNNNKNNDNNNNNNNNNNNEYDNLTTNTRRDSQKTNFGTYPFLPLHTISHLYLYIPMVAGKRLRSQNEKRLQTARWVVKNIFTELRKPIASTGNLATEMYEKNLRGLDHACWGSLFY